MYSRICIFFLLFMLPFIIFPLGISHFEAAKVVVAEAVIMLFLVALILENKSFSHIAKNKVFTIASMGIIALLFIQTVISASTGAITGNPFRLQGSITILFLIMFMLASSYSQIKIGRFIPIITLSLLLVSAVIFPQTNSGRAIGSLGEPNAFAAAIVFVWPFAYSFLRDHKNNKRMLLSVLSVLSAGAGILLYTQSRSGLLAFIAQVGILLVYTKFKWNLKYAMVIYGVVLALSFFLPFLERNRIWENRSEIWITGVYAGYMNPMLGNGFGKIDVALQNAASELRNTIRFQTADSGHNIFIDWWIQGGGGGIIAFVVLTLGAFREYIRNRNLPELLALSGLVVALSFNPASIVSLVCLFWLLGRSTLKAT